MGMGALAEGKALSPMAREGPPKLPHFYTHTHTHTQPILMQVKDGVKNMGATGAGAAVCIPGQVRVVSPN